MRQLLIAFCILSLCAVFSPAMAAEEVTFTGKVTRVDLEGGFWGIVAQDGTKYDPMNLVPEFHKDGMAVTVKGVLRNDVMSMRMWGKIIEIKEIKAADAAAVQPAQPAPPAQGVPENIIISVTRLGRAPMEWIVDKDGNWQTIQVNRRYERQKPGPQVKWTDAQIVELKRNLESVKWAELKPNYPQPQEQVVQDEEGPLQTSYKVVVMVEDKPLTTTIVNPDANKNAPEGLAKAVMMVITFNPQQPVPAPQAPKAPRPPRPRHAEEE